MINLERDGILTWRETHDAERVHEIHLLSTAASPKNMVRPDPLSHFTGHMGERGQTLGCFLDDGTMVGYGVLGMASPTVDRLAGLLQVAREELCLLDGASALPEWRGNGLHFAGIRERILLGQSLGRRYVGSTVAPENIRSVRGLFRSGLRVRQFAPMFGGLMRLIVMRDLQGAEPEWRHALDVALPDHDGHQKAVDDGMTGYRVKPLAGGSWVMEYGYPVE